MNIPSDDFFLLFFFKSGVDDLNFAYDLLSELTRTFLAYADDVRAQDSAAYAIQVLICCSHFRSLFVFCLKYVLVLTKPQELLSIFECREGRTDSPGRRLWRRFPEQIQEILEPHLNSRLASGVHGDSQDPHTPSW